MAARSVSSGVTTQKRGPGMDKGDASAGNRLDIEAILDDLYASEINASISWIWDGGFYAVLGNPKQADGWAFPSIGKAVEWLREQAIVHYPGSEFARKYAQQQRG
jgi:hypothetical protein